LNAALVIASAFTDELGAWGSVGAAVGTVAAFIVAFMQISTERQARERRERETATQRHRSQAERVHAWVSDNNEDHTTYTLFNGSEDPVYRAGAFLVFIQGAGPRTGKGWVALESGEDQVSQYQSFLSIIPPGRSRTEIASGWAIMTGRPAVELAFTDRAGAHWLRAGDGTLTEIPVPAVEFYGNGEEPQDWRIPSEA